MSDDVKYLKYPKNQYAGRIKVFEEMMDYLYKNGFRTINTKEFYKWYTGEIDYYGKTLMITFDDGHYEDYYLVYPIIKKYNFKATSFLVGSKIKNSTKKYNKMITNFIGMDVISKLKKEYPNFEFQSHTFDMHGIKNKKNKLYWMTYKEIEEDFRMNRQFNFTSISYPYGYYNKKIEDFLLHNNNYLVAFTFGKSQYASRKSNRFSIPRISLNSNAGLDKLKKWLIY